MTALRVLVYPHAMELGGSQLNAVELAAAVRDLGHEVEVLSDEGPLLDTVAGLGLVRRALPAQRRRPSAVVVQDLRRELHVKGYDVLHGYEWPAGLEVAAAARGLDTVAPVCTVMSMAVAPFLPASESLVVGTQALQQATQATRPGRVQLIEPPVDVLANAPGHPTGPFRERFGLPRSLATDPRPVVEIGVVCRLVPALKLEGVLTAVDVVADLAGEHPVRLVVVGDGPARGQVQARADAANQRAGRVVVVLTGELADPRPAYASADVMLGMGGSALRSLAFGKPLVVQGELGFWELLTPDSVHTFLQQGWYGLGGGGPEALRAALRRLLEHPEERARLGAFGRDLAVSRFSLRAAALTQEQVYRLALEDRQRSIRGEKRELCVSAVGVTLHKVRERRARLREGADTEDFNAVSLARKPMDADDEPSSG